MELRKCIRCKKPDQPCYTNGYCKPCMSAYQLARYVKKHGCAPRVKAADNPCNKCGAPERAPEKTLCRKCQSDYEKARLSKRPKKKVAKPEPPQVQVILPTPPKTKMSALLARSW